MTTSLRAKPNLENKDLAAAFQVLADRWHCETGMLSSISKKSHHTAYQEIIKMGLAVVPLILREMKVRPAYWFHALEAITHESPIAKGQKVDLAGATAAWLKWGEDRGYLANEPGAE